MSKDDKSGFGSRLWSGGAPAPREREPKPDEKVLPLVKPPAPHGRDYAAFELRESADRLQIRRASGPSRFPGYNYLLDISYDHHLQSAFTMVFTFMIVEVTGRNLEQVVHAISHGKCDIIRQYSARLHDAPAPGEPVIEEIDIVTADEKLMQG